MGERRRQAALAGVLLALGVGFLAYGWRVQSTTDGVSTWPIVDGLVIESTVLARDGGFVPRVRYRYELYGGRFFGQQVERGVAVVATRAAAEAVVARYPEGTRVDVFYNPDRLFESALEFRGGWQGTALLVVGLLALVGGIAACAITVDQVLEDEEA